MAESVLGMDEKRVHNFSSRGLWVGGIKMGLNVCEGADWIWSSGMWGEL